MGGRAAGRFRLALAMVLAVFFWGGCAVIPPTPEMRPGTSVVCIRVQQEDSSFFSPLKIVSLDGVEPERTWANTVGSHRPGQYGIYMGWVMEAFGPGRYMITAVPGQNPRLMFTVAREGEVIYLGEFINAGGKFSIKSDPAKFEAELARRNFKRSWIAGTLSGME